VNFQAIGRAKLLRAALVSAKKAGLTMTMVDNMCYHAQSVEAKKKGLGSGDAAKASYKKAPWYKGKFKGGDSIKFCQAAEVGAFVVRDPVITDDSETLHLAVQAGPKVVHFKIDTVDINGGRWWQFDSNRLFADVTDLIK
jgi:hypothetical protein